MYGGRPGHEVEAHLILGEEELRNEFELGDSVIRTLRALTDGVGATAIADYTWKPLNDPATTRELRRATRVGLIGVTERVAADGSSTLRAQIVSWHATADMAIVWHETAGGGFWEMHLGDGHPQPIAPANVGAAMAFVR